MGLMTWKGEDGTSSEHVSLAAVPLGSVVDVS